MNESTHALHPLRVGMMSTKVSLSVGESRGMDCGSYFRPVTKVSCSQTVSPLSSPRHSRSSSPVPWPLAGVSFAKHVVASAASSCDRHQAGLDIYKSGVAIFAGHWRVWGP